VTETVWVSDAIDDQALIKRLQADVKLDNLRVGEANAHRHVRGETLRSDEIPKKFFADKRYGKIKSLVHLCSCNGFMLTSKQAAEILTKFNLGQGGLSPVEIYQPDKTTVFDLGYNFLNFGAVKHALATAQSERLEERGYGLKNYDMPVVMADDLIAVSAAALTGPDLWTDPLLAGAFFVSDQLAMALKKEKLSKAFRLYRCKMVES
jgi:hypothetical protein